MPREMVFLYQEIMMFFLPREMLFCSHTKGCYAQRDGALCPERWCFMPREIIFHTHNTANGL